MASVPKGACGICRTVQNAIKTVNKNIVKNTIIYSFFSLLILEISTIWLRELDSYDLYLYPILNSVALGVIFYTLYLYKDILKFCQRKRNTLLSLSLYYFFNAFVVIFSICNSTFVNVITYGLLGVVFYNILLTIYQNKK